MDGNLLLQQISCGRTGKRPISGAMSTKINGFTVLVLRLKNGNWRYRVGYGYADDPTDRDADKIKGLPAMYVHLPSRVMRFLLVVHQVRRYCLGNPYWNISRLDKRR